MSYRSESNKLINEKLILEESELPEFVQTYVASSMVALQVSSILQYVYDIKVYLGYMLTHSAAIDELTHSSIKDISFDEFSKISHDEASGFVIWYHAGRADATLSRMLASVSALYSYYIKLNRITYNPILSIRKPKPKKHEINRLKGNEKEKFLDAVMYGSGMTKRQQQFHDKQWLRDYCIMRIFLFTGLRVSELVGLDIEDIDLDLNSLFVTRKGGKTQTIFYDDETKDVLKDYLSERAQCYSVTSDERALFVSMKGNRLSVRSVEVLVEKYRKNAIPNHKGLSPHKLRSTFGTDFYESSGGDLLLTSKRMGHANINTTTIYAEATREREEESRNYLIDNGRSNDNQRRKNG